MRVHLERGLSAAQAARLILDETERRPDESPALARGAESLRQALDALDESAAHTALDTLLANLSLETVLGEVVMPYLHELGERWERGEVSVADEHFASNLLRGRLFGLARGWDRGLGPRALLACAPGEQHDLALIVFGLALRERGWRITYLGPDTPIDSLENAARTLEPAAVVIAVTTPQRLAGTEASLRKVARSVPLWIAGAGASPKVTEKAGARHLDADPLGGADLVAQAHPHGDETRRV
jgi:methanogenic corrinoid protein MtbC1